jgi:hypothetical protein
LANLKLAQFLDRILKFNKVEEVCAVKRNCHVVKVEAIKWQSVPNIDSRLYFLTWLSQLNIMFFENGGFGFFVLGKISDRTICRLNSDISILF